MAVMGRMRLLGGMRPRIFRGQAFMDIGPQVIKKRVGDAGESCVFVGIYKFTAVKAYLVFKEIEAKYNNYNDTTS